MPLTGARTHFFTRGVVVALAILVCGSALDWGHLDGDDRECAPVFVHHDHAAHRFAAAPQSNSPASDHCYICHSLWLLHAGLVGQAGRVATTLESTSTHDVDPLIVRRDFAVLASPRAPPTHFHL